MVLPVAVTRLCPDCDIFTESQICPVCGRDRTFPLAAWLIPIRGAAELPPAARVPLHFRRRLLQGAPARPAGRRVAS
ncbi:MAG: hypothetical protein ACREMB_13775 [Candidatus Rokuibacteriota bacterium]